MRLSATDLACVRGGRRVFAGLSFVIEGGRALAVSGPNGAGKSSLLRVIAGLVRPEAGTLALQGGNAELSIGEQAHYLGHQDALKLALTVHENLTFWTRFHNAGDAIPDAKDGVVDADNHVAQALNAVGLESLRELPAAYLSAGQRRRLSLARLLAVPRPIWLLDEPASALDAAAQATLAGLMRSHLAGGSIILAAVHGPIGLDDAQELRLGGSS